MKSSVVYYLPGWAGQVGTGLGRALLDRGFGVTGRETRGEFKDLPFTAQVETVKEDLLSHFWEPDSLVVANSFGGYLFLHAQASLAPYPGRVLLLSPIVGGFADEETGRFFSPPYEDKLVKLAEAGQLAAPRCCEVHTGSEDWQSHPTALAYFFQLLGLTPHIAEGRGHMLGADYVGPLLDRWLHGASI